jgi:hypothetical protein
MVNKRLISRCLGVFVDDVWSSGVQSVETPTTISVTPILDKGRIQVSKVLHNPRAPIEITITRVLSDLSPPFYMPGTLTNYATSFLLANTNIGMSGWDALKEYDIKVVYGQDNESYLGQTSSSYLSLESFDNCLLSGVSYEFQPTGITTETINLVTHNSSSTGSGLYSSLALPALPETANIFRGRDLDMVNSVFPDIVGTIFDNGFNAAEGRDAEHGKYALTGINLSLSIEYGDLPDRGRPRGSVDATKQNLYKFVSNTVINASFTGIARQEGVDQIVTDSNYNSFATPDEQIKIVGRLGSNYYVWDLGSNNFISSIEESLASTPDTAGEYTLGFSNRRSDFVPYINSSILTLTQSGTY